MARYFQKQSKPLLAALCGQETPTIPFWLMRQAGRYLPEYRELRKSAGSFLNLCLAPDQAARITLQPIERYGMDGAILFSDILIVPYGLGQSLAFKEGEGPVLEPIRDGAALARLSGPGFHDRAAPVYETVRLVKAALPAHVTLLGFAGSPWTVASYMVEGGTSRDFETVKRFAFTDPNGFQRLIDLVVATTIEYLAAQIEAGAEAVQLFDSWCGVLAETEFDRWVIAPNKAIVTALNQRFPHIPVIAFPRGAGLNYERFARAVGQDALGLDTMVPLDGASKLQEICTVQGNLDPLALLAGGEAMDGAVKRLLDGLGGAPYVFNLGHGVMQETPPEHVARLAKLIAGHVRGVAS
jgi:uroporphyrinogen decarboxylase